jgi:ketosteroid isomerase-like protein
MLKDARRQATAVVGAHHFQHRRRESPAPGSADVVRRHIDAYNRRDLRALRALSSPDVELDWTASRWLGAGLYSGVEAVLCFLQDYFDTFEEVIIEPESFTAAGHSVMVANAARMRGREGIEVVARSTLAFTVRSGKVSRVCLHQKPSAPASASLSETVRRSGAR